MNKVDSIKLFFVLGAALSAALIILSFGCGGNGDDENERDYGSQGSGNWGDYYNDDNEEPGFGDPEIQAMTEDEPYDDPFDVQTKGESDQNVIYLRVLWGNLILDEEDDQNAKDYSGSIHVDDGLLVIERTVRFDYADSEIDTREDPTLVSWKSLIYPHYDGLVLRLEPGDTTSGNNFLHFEIGPYKKDIAVSDLADLLLLEASGYDDDQIAIASHAAVSGGSGFVTGHWRDLPDVEGGIFKGKWETGSGVLLGHERARYLPESDGAGIVKGKYIDLEGNFMGYLRGSYQDTHETLQAGNFSLDWIDQDKTQLGSVEGIYFKKNDSGYGFALGNWFAE